ncbi:peptidase M15B and M15C DD-carboxypeptidase VanY/endolysin [Microbacterium sp. CH12i]|uniref:M15 family metallopeptidase n=1 Tax=Microbacterium sp. CH12i TaxID=1479651 RepID=UPI000460B760|nr:M15 family metallopeptidase [Microbacterium sp. CH12i]KDA05451.1 peptidase M15B and M15C DD-carboxypeptidase VanY/endolysin [Microbacterium sp. CH12i]
MSDALRPRHASRRPRALTVALPIGLAVTALGALWALADVPVVAEAELPPMPVVAAALPEVDLTGVIATDPCSDAGVVDALSSGDDAATIAAFGGGVAFRDAVVAGNAPCILLNDPARFWVVVNKTRPLAPLEFVPDPVATPALTATTASDLLRTDAMTALNAMVAAAAEAGAGSIGMNNGYRSYDLQVATYSSFVDAEGQAGADQGSARPGFSEHQTGLAVDLVACAGGCTSIDEFGDTVQSSWVQEHAWEYGFVVRYESGATDRTGYMPEPWHVRYIGTELAAVYHAGGYRTLEEFFQLPAAPDYPH